MNHERQMRNYQNCQRNVPEQYRQPVRGFIGRSLIGSLASVINYRIYVREYPGKGKNFIKVFTFISWAFFLIVVIPGLLLSQWNFFS